MNRPWAYLVFGVAFVANSVSLILGGTHPKLPDTTMWIGLAWATAAICFLFVSFPRASVRGVSLSQIASAALIIAAGSRAIGAIGWNPQLWSRFGGGSIWTMTTVGFWQLHAARRHRCRLVG